MRRRKILFSLPGGSSRTRLPRTATDESTVGPYRTGADRVCRRQAAGQQPRRVLAGDPPRQLLLEEESVLQEASRLGSGKRTGDPGLRNQSLTHASFLDGGRPAVAVPGRMSRMETI